MSAAFFALGLPEQFTAALREAGMVEPTPVQAQAIPILLAGSDLVATAPTGTGKTAAFLLPALTRIARPAQIRSKGPRILVLTPTRELAQQVSKASVELSRGLGRMKTVCVTGGESYVVQNRNLTSPHEVLVATPGRLMDQMKSGRIDFSRLEVLVLDEADRMLDMGFAEDVMAIAGQLPQDRQTVCFTATISPSIKQLAGQLMREPQWMEIATETRRHDAIDQHAIYVDDIDHKRRLLRHWLERGDLEQAIVFTATKRDAEQLAIDLEGEGHSAVALHGDLQQRHRTRMLNRLRHGDARILVATDVAARGLDVPGITHVFNFDLPKFAEDYVHRIGRTGRAGATGTAISFVGRQDVFVLKRIERFIGAKVQVTQVAGMEGRHKPGDRPTSSTPRGRRPEDGRKFGAKPAFGQNKPWHKGNAGSGNREQRPGYGNDTRQGAGNDSRGNGERRSFDGDKRGFGDDSRPRRAGNRYA